MIAIDGAGEGVRLESRGRGETMRKTDEQIQRQRNDDWRRDHDEGVPDRRGRPVRRSVRLIAALYGVEPSTVSRGIEQARRIREAIGYVAVGAVA